MVDKPAFEGFLAAEDAGDLLACACAADLDAAVIAHGEGDTGEEGNGDDVLGIGWGVGVEADGVEDVPGGGLACVVHACVGEVVFTHVVVFIHEDVEDVLGLLLLADEVVGVGDAVVGLVAVAVVAQEAGEVPRFVLSPGLAEEGVEFLLDGLVAGIEGNHAFRVVGSEEEALPGVGLAVHVGVVGIVGVEVLDPLAAGYLAAPEACGGVEEVLVVACAAHEELVVLLVAEDLGELGYGIVVVGVFLGLGDGCLVLVFCRDVGGVFLCYPSLADILVEEGTAASSWDGGIAEEELVGALEVEALDAA